MSDWAWFVEGVCAGIVLMLVGVWFILAIIRIERAEREKESR